jgi:hypothetical protein
MKHTPGPWEIEDGWVIDTDKRTICNPRCMDPSDAGNITEMGHNTYLIAAAPELLEVCEEILFYWSCCEPQNAKVQLEKKLSDIINKAKGE